MVELVADKSRNDAINVDRAEGASSAPGHTQEEQPTQSDYVILAYNVPEEYTVRVLEELIVQTVAVKKHFRIMPTFPWENRRLAPRRILLNDKKTYDAILEKQDIWVKSESAAQASRSITFVPGNALDIPDIPFKADTELLINDDKEQQVSQSTVSSSPLKSKQNNSNNED